MRQNLLYALVGVIAISAVGCNAPGGNTLPSTTKANRSMDAMRRNFGRHLTGMSDSALLHEMSIVDEHFVPHTTELNGTGAARLERMAILLNTYGGTVRYNSRMATADMVGDRIAHVREYLEVSGCDMSRVRVESMLSGGYGERAIKSIAVDDRGPLSSEASASQTSLKDQQAN